MNNTYIILAVIPGLFFMVGLIFFIIGIIMLINFRKKRSNCTSKTLGKVINIIKCSNRAIDRGYTYTWHPVLEYYVGNLKIIKKSAYGHTKPKYVIGQNVEICYNPNKYDECYISNEKTSKMLGIIFTFAGILEISIAILTTILILIIK